MPQFLNTKAHEQFFGLSVDGDGTDIKRDETPDSANDDISTKGELNMRPGIEKQNSTAETGGAITFIGFLSVGNVVTKLIKIGGEIRVV